MQHIFLDYVWKKGAQKNGANFWKIQKVISDVLPLVALLAGETVEMVDVAFGSHDHLKGRNGFAASGAIARRSE
jgi:hypothetical protein